MLISNFANRLDEALKLKHLTPAEVVRRSEVLFNEGKIFKPLTKPQMTNYLKGTYEAKQDNVYALSLILDVDEAWLMGCDVPMERHSSEKEDELLKKIGAIPLSDLDKDMVKIPILGTVKAGYDYLAQENIIDYIAFKLDGSDKENYYALNVVGDSMEPLFDDGDTVIVHKQDDFKNGENCVVLINGEEATVKKVYKKDNGLELQAVNPYYPTKLFSEEDIKKYPVKVIGVVEKSIRNFKKNKK
ncbi:MAG: hypothetical protein HFJ20_07185 [Clostridia bacterium]|nr:hypothetical protein [Clostridia bacterium]